MKKLFLFIKLMVVVSTFAAGFISIVGSDGGGGGSDSGSNTDSITNNGYVGTWVGTINVEGEDRQAKLTLDDTLTGSFVVTGASRVDTFQPIKGNIVNGVLYFDMPVSDLDVGAPGCDSWDMSSEGRLSENMTRMTMDMHGTVCGGKNEDQSIILYKQGAEYVRITSISPPEGTVIDRGSDTEFSVTIEWSFEGSSAGFDGAWVYDDGSYSPVCQDKSGENSWNINDCFDFIVMTNNKGSFTYSWTQHSYNWSGYGNTEPMTFSIYMWTDKIEAFSDSVTYY